MSIRLLVILALLMLSFGGAPASADQCSAVFHDSSVVLQTKYGPVTLTSQEAIALRQDQLEIGAALKQKGPAKMRALLDYAKQKTRSRVNVGLTYANYVLAAMMGADIVVKLAENPHSIPASLALLPATLVAADAVSSGYHYFLDNWASEKNKYWGNPARAFRRHHEVPNNLNELGYVQNVAAFSKLMAPLYVASAVASPHMAPEVQTQVLMALLLFSNGTEIHRQAHLPKPNFIVRGLQKSRVILGKEVHNDHHRRPTDSDYGIINGLSNRATNKFYDWLNRVFAKASRRLPNTWIQTPRSIPDDVIADLMNDLSHVPQELIVSATQEKHSDARVDNLVRLWVEQYGDQMTEGANP